MEDAKDLTAYDNTVIDSLNLENVCKTMCDYAESLRVPLLRSFLNEK